MRVGGPIYISHTISSVKVLRVEKLASKLHMLSGNHDVKPVHTRHFPVITSHTRHCPVITSHTRHFPALISALVGNRFQAKPATLLIPIDLFVTILWPWWSFKVPGIKVADFFKMQGLVFTACVVFLFSLWLKRNGRSDVTLTYCYMRVAYNDVLCQKATSKSKIKLNGYVHTLMLSFFFGTRG